MLEAGQKAENYARATTLERLAEDEILRPALVRLLEIVDEAASRVSQQCRNQQSEIPWSEIAGMRNRLIHGYYQIDLQVLWQTLRRDLPSLIGQRSVNWNVG